MIEKNILAIREDLPDHVQILAATKKRSVDEIDQAIAAGIQTIGENYVQEAKEKYELKGKVDFHLIGHLQSNKAKDAVEIFDMIQTIDTEKIARKIDEECKKQKKAMSILIEVNAGKEENKHGCMPEDVEKLAEKITALKNLRLKGLMTMGPAGKDPKPYFKLIKNLYNKLKTKYPQIDTLSMGMSDSYRVAIEEGATMIRLGTILFGERNIYKN